MREQSMPVGLQRWETVRITITNSFNAKRDFQFSNFIQSNHFANLGNNFSCGSQNGKNRWNSFDNFCSNSIATSVLSLNQ
jgi:hypothetical protein